MSQRIPVTVITGFLGAGKTTLLRYLLTESEMRLAVMINEFGSVGLDGDLIKTCSFCDEEEIGNRIVELNNGCLCCTVQDDFLPTIELLLANPEHLDGIIIETSGLALPRPLIDALEWPEIKTKVYLNGLITIVDSQALALGSPVGDMLAIDKQRDQDESLDHLTPINELYDNQLKAADIVLLSRADLVSKETLYSVKEQVINKVIKGTRVLPISNGKINPSLILGITKIQKEQRQNLKVALDIAKHDHEHVDVISNSIRIEGEIEFSEFQELLIVLSNKYQILRLKGRIWIEGKALPLQIQMVGTRITTWFEAVPNNSWKPEKAGVDLVILSLKDGVTNEIAKAFS